MDDLECDLVETSSHLGARPSHAMWQGKVFSRSGKHKKYPNFKKGTGYGTGDGLCGWNCRHMFFPYFEGLSSVSAKRYSMQENERVYNLEQKQRYNERMIRKYRREERVLRAGEQDYTFAQSKAIKWSKTNEALINSNSDVLKRNYFNETIAKQKYSLVANNIGDFTKSTYTQVGKLTKLDSETKLNVLKAYEKQIVELNVENAIVILKNGDVFKVAGNSSGVDPTVVGDLTGSFITHNHPKDETWYTFSGEDFSLFHYHKLEVLRGIDDVYEYELNRSGILSEYLDVYKDNTAILHNKMRDRAKELKYGYQRQRKT